MPDSFSLKLYAAGDIGSGKQGQLFEMTAKKRKTHPAATDARQRASTNTRQPAVTDARKPTDRDLAAMRKFMDKRSQPAPRLKVSKSGDHLTITLDHPLDQPDKINGLPHLMDALGTTDMDFFNGLVDQLERATSRGAEVNEVGINFMLSIIKDIEPRDQLEAMLAAQMAAVHIATMTFAGRLARADNTALQDSAERAFNKLARTYVAQMEALKRYRTGGEQKVTVQHVTVSEGGQAIVGNVTQDQREAVPDKAAPKRPLLADAKMTPMPIIPDTKEPVPVWRGEKKTNDE
jgi:hypothetical protein